MVLDLFGGKSRTGGPAPLLQRRNYEKAIAELRAELQKRKKDERLRLQLADMLVLANKAKEAVEVLNGLADDLAWDGFAAKAIAVLKKIEKIQPGRSEVEEKLAYLIGQKSRPSGDPWAAGAGTPASGTEEIGLNLGPARSVAAAEPAAAPAAEPFDLGLSSPGTAGGEEAVSAEELQGDLLALIGDVFKPVDQPAAPPAAPAGAPVVETPLFSSLAKDELLQVMRKMRLKFYEPGEIIVAEGQPGDSLFIITTGVVRAYVRTPGGAMDEVRRMGEGDFFGEISVLSGGQRTATITAADNCELLEFDQASLDAIAQTHPNVREVMKEFAAKRQGS